MAALRGWATETKLSVLLDYIGRQANDAAFLDFVAEQDAHPAMNEADHFLWAVAERLQHPGLALDAGFQLFCFDTFDLFTPDELLLNGIGANRPDTHHRGDLSCPFSPLASIATCSPVPAPHSRRRATLTMPRAPR